MSDLRKRLAQLDRLPSEVLWTEIRSRPERPDLMVEGTNDHGPRQRLVAGVIAIAVFAAAAVFTWEAFRAKDVPTPVASISTTPVTAVVETLDTGLRFPEGVVVGEGAVWVAGSDLSSTKGTLLRLDPVTRDIEARIAMPVPGWEFGGAGLATGLGSVWVAAGADGQSGAWLYRVDPSTNEVAETIEVGPGSAWDVWVDDSGIWVLAYENTSLRLFRLDPKTHAVVATTDVPATWSQTVVGSGGSIWVPGNTDKSNGAPPETLFQIDPSTNDIIARTKPADGQEFFIVGSADRLWFYDRGLRALDATTGQEIIGPLDLPEDCCSALTPDGVGGVWVLATARSAGQGGIWHVDADGNVDQQSDFDLGADADGQASAWDPVTNSIWVVHSERTVSQIQITDASPEPSVGGTQGEVFFPTTQSGPTGMEALYEGSLTERDGCIFMSGGEQVALPIWPEGYTVDRDQSGALQVHAEDGSTVAVVGQPMSMGGGYIAEFFPVDKVEPRDKQLASVNQQLDELIPQQCLASDLYGIWLVGSIDVPSS